ncbi:MAG: hypothetical protein IPM98_12895 [Lewinellaceae bacterium]|nr:hypothetical protein [Lewinellaceae bacterium]
MPNVAKQRAIPDTNRFNISICISIFFIFITAAQSLHLQPAPVSIKTNYASVTTEIPFRLILPKMWACNTNLYKNETLVLHFKPPNAPFLGVIDPQGHFFYLVYPAESSVGSLTPFVGSACFENIQTLKIDTRSLQADPYTYGVYTNQPVFTMSGDYIFIMGENLHVDDPTLLGKVTVHYKHTLRTSQAHMNIAVN